MAQEGNFYFFLTLTAHLALLAKGKVISPYPVRNQSFDGPSMDAPQIEMDCIAPFNPVTTPGTTITSPNYPGDYPVGVDCETTITFTKKVALKFNDFYVDFSDWLEIRDGAQSNSPVITKATGYSKFKAESSGTSMTIHLHTIDEPHDEKGFTSVAYSMANPLATCSVTPKKLDEFKLKHVNENNPSLYEAASTSCWRNVRNQKIPGSKFNSVLFSRNLQTYSDGTIDSANCQSTITEVYQCQNVPLNIFPEAVPGCIDKLVDNNYCKSCKVNYPQATEFEVEIEKTTGHLLYDSSWYVDGQINTGRIKPQIDFRSCSL